MRNQTILACSVVIGILYAVLVIATWVIFRGEGITARDALAGSVVYAFYIVIVFGAVVLGSVVAFMLKRERDVTLR